MQEAVQNEATNSETNAQPNAQPMRIVTDFGGVSGDQLRQFIERIERMEEEKANISADIREIYAEAKGTGFDPKVMRQIVKLRKMNRDDRQEQEALLETYMAALGMEV